MHAVGATGRALRVLDLRLGQAPDARNARELAGARVAQQLLAGRVAAVGRVVARFDAPVRELHVRDVGRRLAFVLCAALHLPRAHARRLACVLGEVAVGVDRPLARAQHPHEDAQGLGVRDPLPAVANRVAAEQIRHSAQRALGGLLANPPGLCCRRRSARCPRPPAASRRTARVALLGADAQQERLEHRGPQLLFAALPNGAPRNGRDRRGHWINVRSDDARGETGQARVSSR